jgi:hypothetical protein
MDKYLELSSKYDTFIYDSYKVYKEDNKLKVDYHYIIKDLEDFNTTLSIDESEIKNKNIDNNMLEYLAFHIGLVELLSYWKCVCSRNIIINCGYLDDDQINWFKKLYYNGLGEFFYVNNIEVDKDTFVNIKCTGDKLVLNNNYNGVGNLITIGGGKDSIVACELLRSLYDENTCFSLNPKSVHIDSIDALGYHDKKIFVRKTYVDKKLIELNKQGYLNGHTPFSSLLAFISYFTAYLTGRKYIVLSNESSANEATVIGTNINHQYSKTYEFENDFNNYTKKYYGIDIKYFSLLRPLTEFQIGMLFSKLDKFHKVFKSCNLGSKGDTWEWCCKCPKCLFVFIILSPFLYKDKLIDIFGSDLYEDTSLLDTFKELLGYSETKPFECVGTYGEVRFAVSLLIDKLGDDLPYLLRYYKDNYPLSLDTDYRLHYNKNNNLDSSFESIVKDAISNV